MALALHEEIRSQDINSGKGIKRLRQLASKADHKESMASQHSGKSGCTISQGGLNLEAGTWHCNR
jgi:hypothetical protein